MIHDAVPQRVAEAFRHGPEDRSCRGACGLGRTWFQWVYSSTGTSPSLARMAAIMVSRLGQGKPMGDPLVMQEASATASAPRDTSIWARDTASLPGATPAADEADQLAGTERLKDSLARIDQFQICGSGAEVFCLPTADYAYLFHSFLLEDEAFQPEGPDCRNDGRRTVF